MPRRSLGRLLSSAPLSEAADEDCAAREDATGLASLVFESLGLESAGLVSPVCVGAGLGAGELEGVQWLGVDGVGRGYTGATPPDIARLKEALD